MDYEDDILVETEIDTEIETEEEVLKQKETEEKKQFKNFPKYSNEKLERVYNKYDFSKTYNPNTQKDSGKSFEKFVKENSESDVLEESITIEKKELKREELNSKKYSIFKICGTFVCALLIILSMINLSTITDLEKKVENNQNKANEIEVNVGKLIQDVGKLTDEEQLLNQAQQNGMQEVGEEIEIVLNEKNEIIEYESKTNFFDRICEAISNIFGG